METPDILKLILAMAIGYGILFFMIWIFKKKRENGDGK